MRLSAMTRIIVKISGFRVSGLPGAGLLVGLIPCVIVGLALGVTLGVTSGPAVSAAVGQQSGLPVPRFVSLRAPEVNARAGPGARYPIKWVYKRQNYPVQIIAEFDTWRRIRDVEGNESWMHKSMLSGLHTVLVVKETRPLRSDADPVASTVARMEPGVLAHLEECEGGWCEVRVSGISGWVRRDHIWGAPPAELPATQRN